MTKASIGLIISSFSEAKTYIDELHPKEKEYYNNIKSTKRNHSYLLGRLAAKRALQKYSEDTNHNEIFIERGVFGFPVIRAKTISNIKISISHTEDIGISIAFPEEHIMGIDVEKIILTHSKALQSQLVKNEKAMMGNSIIAYTSAFSMKECLSKVLKTGMMMDFKLLEINKFYWGKNCFCCTFLNFPQYKAVSFKKNNFVFSFVLPKKTLIDFRKFYASIPNINEHQ